MCHNKETSMVIWIFAIAVFIHLLLEYTKTQNTVYIFAAMFILLISSMQLVEFFIHSGYKFPSKWVFYVFILQFIYCEVYLWYNNLLPIGMCVLDTVFYIGLIPLIYIVYKISSGDITNKIICDEYSYLKLGCKLNWGIVDEITKVVPLLAAIMGLIYIIYVLIGIYNMFTLPVFIVFLLILIITVFVPGIMNAIKKGRIGELIHTQGSSSAWCFFAVILVLFTIALDESNVIKGV